MWLSWSKHNLVFNKQYMLGLVCDGIGLLSNIYVTRIRYAVLVYLSICVTFVWWTVVVVCTSRSSRIWSIIVQLLQIKHIILPAVTHGFASLRGVELLVGNNKVLPVSCFQLIWWRKHWTLWTNAKWLSLIIYLLIIIINRSKMGLVLYIITLLLN